MKNVVKKYIFLLLFVLCSPTSFAEQVSSTPQLISKLQSGGYIIYMRHGKTTKKNANRNKKKVDFSRCETQRNLSIEGVAQVKEIGQMIKTLNIPIGKVTSSPYCRTKDTAKNVFGIFSIDENLAFSIGKVEKESKRLGDHTANLKDGLGIWPKPEGVVVIFEKLESKIKYLGMITPEQWTEHSATIVEKQ